MQVRDTLLKKQGLGTGLEIERPQSELMLKYQSDLTAKAVASGGGMSPLASQALQGLAKTAPDYRRNRARICSFFLKGTCNRGDSCPFRHEKSDHTDITLAAQNIQDRYYGTQDPLAKKILERVHDPKSSQTTGPEVSTVWVSGVLPEKNISQQDLKDHFYAFGEIVSVRLVPASKCAFIEFATHDQATHAIDSLRNNLVIRGQFLKVGWAKPQTHRVDRAYMAADAAASSIPPPPGYVPFNPVAPGAPPPGAAGPLGWAPMYYPSMNPQRMGAVDPSASTSSSSSSSSHHASSNPSHSVAKRSSEHASTSPKVSNVEEPDSAQSSGHPQHSHPSAATSSSVKVTEVEGSSEDIPPGGRVKRSGGSEGTEHDARSGASKKVKV